MKKVLSVLAIVLSSLLIFTLAGNGLKTYKEKSLIKDIRVALNNINDSVKKGIDYESYSLSIIKLQETLKFCKSKINVEKHQTELTPLLKATVDYTIVQLLWTENLSNEVMVSKDVVLVRDGLLPPEISRQTMREASRLTVEAVFGKDDLAFQKAGVYLLPKNIAFSIYWLHASDLLEGKIH